MDLLKETPPALHHAAAENKMYWKYWLSQDLCTPAVWQLSEIIYPAVLYRDGIIRLESDLEMSREHKDFLWLDEPGQTAE